ncbi:hypothetical protein HG536_0H01710 [Torulaspora globosa]|uniref:RNA helicase n=1 Tax=Torulaspora globosa TaxID=48254 RepID=A0A7G3ZMR0_9SACH|nr:uncharacterized protein HG536_0H01710 [Torulaspora globosa]QLL34796.1 hypothetical protein HG536_0H01710 [Torulaspora globosa]
MSRPPSLSELLRSKSKIKNNDLLRPKFLSKSERQKVIKPSITAQSQRNSRSQLGMRKLSESNEEEGPQNASDHVKSTVVKRTKFAFDWSEDSDTLAGYQPIVNPQLSSLLQNEQHNSSLELAYMGKPWREKTWEEMTDRDWRILKEEFEITTKGGSIENPLRNWHELGLLGKELENILVKRLGYKEPTPIQRIAIPNICRKDKRDFLGIASTGSGKTLAFLIPILTRMNNSQPRPIAVKTLEGPKAIVLAPTRELAQQIQQEAKKMVDCWNVQHPQHSYQVVSIVGGHSLEEITLGLSNGTDILVATPGRLIDSLESHLFSARQVEMLVLDEADKMIDLGFEEQLTKILNILEASSEVITRRQTIMFTATMSPSVERIANGYLHKPAYATVTGTEASVPQIRQIICHISTDEQRFQKIKGLLSEYSAPIIVFITYKKTADWLAQKFYQETSVKVTVLHGSKSQEQREHSLQLLRTGKVQVLIASNVAARGLDIPNVSLVLNFQVPKQFEDYIHRIGRTGRAGSKGTAVSFLGDDENPEIVEAIWKYSRDNNPTNSNEFDYSLKTLYKLGKNEMNEIIL